ncbi:MAG: pilus assembly protein HicB [Bacteroidia bacterium]|nr:pilus assembly protein HicB [Bacteroidia bacterium]
METIALIEQGKDGSFTIYTPDLQCTITGSGQSVKAAKEDFNNSVSEMILSYTETGRELPDELQSLTFEYKYDIASLFDYYNWINVSKFAKIAGINASLMRQYKKGLSYISERQANKIEVALRKLGNELSEISL